MAKKEGILVIALLIITAGCTSYNPEDIKDRIIKANSEIGSYDLDMDMKMSMHTVSQEHDFQASTDLNYKGTIDKENERLFLNMTGMIDIGMESEIDMEMYYYDDYFYTGTLGYWTKQKAPDEIWNQQEQVQNILKIIKDAEIEILKTDSSTIELRITPDQNRLLSYALKDPEPATDLTQRKIDYEKLIQESEIILWIDKSSFLIERQKLNIKFMMTPDNMGFSSSEGSGSRIDMSLMVDIKMYNIDEIEKIIIPKDAKDAVDAGEFDSGTITLADLNMISAQTVSEILG